ASITPPAMNPNAAAAVPTAAPDVDQPSAASIDARPGPVYANAIAAAAITRGSSNPPLLFHRPFGKWTARVPTITPTIAALPSGVRKPSIRSAPPPASDIPARYAIGRPGA